MTDEKRIIITHCVDPNRFYFKYVNDCVNCDYSKFDYEIQSYGNKLHGQKIEKSRRTDKIPNKNEIIIFFDVMLNKWLRGRVINSDGDEVNLWCIDNGIFRRANVQFIQPLTEIFKQDFNLVHLGGLTVLPAENKLDFGTLNVTLRVTKSWDTEMKINFKAVVGSSKRLIFVEQMECGTYLTPHKFGQLLTESNGKVVSINEILLEMNKAIVCGRSAEDMWSCVSEEPLEKYFLTTFCDSKQTVNAPERSKLEEQSNTGNSEDCNGPKLSLHSHSQSDQDNSIRHHDELENETDASSLDEYFDTFENSDSMSVSTIHSLESQSTVPDTRRNGRKAKSLDYDCYLRTFAAIKKGTLRQPLQSSIDWINRLNVSVAEAEDNKSCSGSSINSADSDDSDDSTSSSTV